MSCNCNVAGRGEAVTTSGSSTGYRYGLNRFLPETGGGSAVSRDGIDGQAVGEFVHRVAAVALDPSETHVSDIDELDQRLPEVDVGDGLLLRVLEPFFSHLTQDWSRKQFTTYVESDTISIGIGVPWAPASGRATARVEHGIDLHALIRRAARPAEPCGSPPGDTAHPQPPGPGFPLQAPSV